MDDWRFLVTIVVAALIRVATSPFHSVLRAVLMVVTSVFVAWAFTAGVVDYLHLNPDIYKVPVGALLALTADGLVRAGINWASSPSGLQGLLSRLTGRGENGGPDK